MIKEGTIFKFQACVSRQWYVPNIAKILLFPRKSRFYANFMFPILMCVYIICIDKPERTCLYAEFEQSNDSMILSTSTLRGTVHISKVNHHKIILILGTAPLYGKNIRPLPLPSPPPLRITDSQKWIYSFSSRHSSISSCFSLPSFWKILRGWEFGSIFAVKYLDYLEFSYFQLTGTCRASVS